MNSEDASAKDVLQQCARNLINVAQQLQSCDRVTQTSQMNPTENRQTYVLQEHRASLALCRHPVARQGLRYNGGPKYELGGC